MEKTLNQNQITITDKIQQVTNKIVGLLEQGEKAWVFHYEPKYQNKRIIPYNLKTKKDYSGINYTLPPASNLHLLSSAFLLTTQ